MLNLDEVRPEFDTVALAGEEYRLRRGTDLTQSEMVAVERLAENPTTSEAFKVLDILFDGPAPALTIAQASKVLEYFAARLQAHAGEATES